jgi:hypothetical protein
MARKKTLLGLFAFSALCLSACAVNLGTFENSDGYEKYYDSFGDVKGLYDGGDHTYDLRDSLFNAKTVQEYKWEDEDDEVVLEQYLYIIIPCEDELKIDSIAFCVYAEAPVNFVLSAFYFEDDSSTPQKIKYLSSPDTKPIYDDDGNQIGEEPIEYDDPPLEQSLVYGDKDLTGQAWTSLGLSNFKQSGYDDNYLHTVDGGLIYLRIENNSGWNKEVYKPLSLRFVNLMIRAI